MLIISLAFSLFVSCKGDINNMSYRKLSPSEIKIKEPVSDTLKTYYDYQLNHYDLSDEIRSFSTSLIRTSNDKHYSKPDSNFLTVILKR